MRITDLDISGFRGFGNDYLFDLDADAIVVVGSNGSGKTSFFDAILWCLTGCVPRLAVEDDQLVSLFSGTGHARVKLGVRTSDGAVYAITRTFDGQNSHLSVTANNSSLKTTAAETLLAQLLWPQAAAAPATTRAIADVLTRSVYLQQDLIRHFIEAATDDERFSAVSELCGAGRVTEFQSALENEKKAWTTATNRKKQDSDQLEDQLRSLERRISELSVSEEATASFPLEKEWKDWRESLGTAGLSVESHPDRDAGRAVDEILRQLTAQRSQAQRKHDELLAFETELQKEESPSVEGDIESQRLAVAALVETIEITRRQLQSAKDLATERRRVQRELTETHEQMNALASLALNLLGERCPVCEQVYDREKTRQRLERLLAAETPALEGEESEDLESIAAQLAEQERELASAEGQLAAIEGTENRRKVRVETQKKRAAEIGLLGDFNDLSSLARLAREDALLTLKRLSELHSKGERISLHLADAAATAALDEVTREAEKLKKELERLDNEVHARTETGDQVQTVIEALREASSEVVSERVRDIEPLLQTMYSRIDPHPAFRTVRLLADMARGRGKLRLALKDVREAKESTLPAAVLSSSQLNALAVCAFLALSLGVQRSSLSAILLDDPFQTLDDVNLLGVLDLLRRLKDTRQLFVSTHDKRFAHVVARKLRPSARAGRTIVWELSGWKRQGPTTSMLDVPNDPVRLRLIAS